MLQATTVLPLVPSVPPLSRASKAHSWLRHLTSSPTLPKCVYQVLSSQLHIQRTNPIITHRKRNEDKNNHLLSTYHTSHCCKHFTCTDSLRGRYNPWEGTERCSRVQWPVWHIPDHRRTAINLGKETSSSSSQMSPLVRSGENLSISPSRNAPHLLPPHPTGGALTNVTGQTLSFIGPHFTSNEVTWWVSHMHYLKTMPFINWGNWGSDAKWSLTHHLLRLKWYVSEWLRPRSGSSSQMTRLRKWKPPLWGSLDSQTWRQRSG